MTGLSPVLAVGLSLSLLAFPQGAASADSSARLASTADVPPCDTVARASSTSPVGGDLPAGETTASLAITSATWTPSTKGDDVYWQAVAFAPTVCRLVGFGGSWKGVYDGATRLLDPTTGGWTKITATRSDPSSRGHATLAWDPARSRAVLFGGTNGPSLQDTWAFDPASGAWAPLVTNCRRYVCPPARWGHGMVWSSVLRKEIVFGGMSGNTWLNDVWAYGASWSPIATSTRPLARYDSGMAEDASTGRIVVYGGFGQSSAYLSDTWIFDPATSTWTKVTTPHVPDAQVEVAMGWSPSLRAVTIFGGKNTSEQFTSSVWVFDMVALDWVRITTTGGTPTPRGDATLTADPCHGTAILLGPPGIEGTVYPPPQTDYTWILK